MDSPMASRVLAAHVAKAVAAHRFLLGLSQAELAAKVGVTRQHIDLVERGKVSPSLKTLEALATALGVRAGDLMP